MMILSGLNVGPTCATPNGSAYISGYLFNVGIEGTSYCLKLVGQSNMFSGTIKLPDINKHIIDVGYITGRDRMTWFNTEFLGNS